MRAYYASGIVLGTLCILLNHPDKLRYPDTTNNIIPFCRGEKGEQTSEVPWTRSENLWQLGAGPSLHGCGIRSCSCCSTQPCQSPLLPPRTSAPSYRSQLPLLPLLPSFIANKWFSRQLLCRLCFKIVYLDVSQIHWKHKSGLRLPSLWCLCTCLPPGDFKNVDQF